MRAPAALARSTVPSVLWRPLKGCFEIHGLELLDDRPYGLLFVKGGDEDADVFIFGG